MSKLKKIYFSILLLIFSILNVNALNLESDISLENVTSNSLDLSWEPVEGAIGYFVYYDIVSHEDDQNYTYSVDEMIEGTGVLLDKLDSSKDYYISLRVVDGDGNEGDFSKEFTFTTSSENSDEIFIKNLNVVNKNTILLEFNVDIDSTKEVLFRITKGDDNLNELLIKDVLSSNNEVKLVLLNSLENNENYKLTIISISGIHGETIKSGINGLFEFKTGNLDELEDSNQEELNSALSGENLDDNEIKKTPELAAKKTDKLPQTGPAEWLLFVIALMLAFGITRFRKQA